MRRQPVVVAGPRCWLEAITSANNGLTRFLSFLCRAFVALLHLGVQQKGVACLEELSSIGALLALVAVLVIGILIGVVIGRAGSVKTPLGEVSVEQESSPTTVTVQVSGSKGLRYTGTIGTLETGQKSIDGTLGTNPDNYKLPLNTSPGSTDGVTAEVGKNPLDVRGPGTLSLQLLVDGQVARN